MDTCQKIEEQTQQLTILIEELLGKQCRLSSQNVSPSQHCDLTALCDRIVEHQRLTTGRPITLTVSSTTLMVPGHPHHLEQVLNNLITNAIKYSPEDGHVEVALHQKDDMARMSVYNTGSGIAPDLLPLLFTPYYRTPEAQSSSIPGQGLGLAIVQTLVEQLHGHVWCESTLGEWTTFIVELPLIQKN